MCGCGLIEVDFGLAARFDYDGACAVGKDAITVLINVSLIGTMILTLEAYGVSGVGKLTGQRQRC